MNGSWFAIVNPASGGGRGARDLAKIAARLREAGIAFDLASSERSGHSAELAAAAARNGSRRFLAIGGDGTLSEVLNGVLASGVVGRGEATLGLLPVGRGNDWARTHGIPRDYGKAIGVLATGRSVAHDVGVAQAEGREPALPRRYFMNAAGAGFDAHVVERTRGRDLGMLSYMAALPASLLSFHAPELEVQSDEERISGRVFMAFAALNRYCGGGMLVAPDARYDDGLLDITILDEISLPELLLNIRKLYDGSLPAYRKVRTFRTAAVRISGPAPVNCEADGELIGATPVRLSVLPGHVNVVVPA